MGVEKTNVSIIVPIYNSEETIEDCVNSLINQSLKNIEIILVDDGSTDNTSNIVDNLKTKDNRIIVIHKSNGGVSSARNLGIGNASGEYIGFIDSDDAIHPTMYEKLYNKVQSEKSSMGMCRFCVTSDNYKKEEVWDVKLDKSNLAQSMFYNMIAMNDEESFNNMDTIMGSTCRCLYKREIIKRNKIMFHKEITYAEDLIFNLEYLRKINKVSIVDEPLYYYKTKGKSLSLGYRKNFYSMINKLMNKIESVTENTNIENRLSYSWLSYLIETLRNATRGIKFINSERINKIKEVVKDNKNKDRLKNINYKKLNTKNRLFYLIFYNNSMSLAMAFYVFRCVKNIIKIN